MTHTPITKEERERAVASMQARFPGAHIDWLNWLFAYEAALSSAEKRIEELEAALRPFADEAKRYDPDGNDGHFFNAWDSTFVIGDLRRARAALQQEESGE